MSVNTVQLAILNRDVLKGCVLERPRQFEESDNKHLQDSRTCIVGQETAVERIEVERGGTTLAVDSG